MKLDQSYWNERYLNSKTAWDLKRVSHPMKHIIDRLEDKNAAILIPGAGNAHEARYLLERGFTNVTVLDIASDPINRLKKSLYALHLNVIQQDFFEHQGSYDIILEQTFFCALESRFRESYPRQASMLLKDNGALTGVLFNFPDLRAEPPYGGSAAEYQSLFEPWFHIATIKDCEHSEIERTGKELFIHLIKK
jgi:thiopurine S-methyltransferase